MRQRPLSFCVCVCVSRALIASHLRYPIEIRRIPSCGLLWRGGDWCYAPVLGQTSVCCVCVSHPISHPIPNGCCKLVANCTNGVCADLFVDSDVEGKLHDLAFAYALSQAQMTDTIRILSLLAMMKGGSMDGSRSKGMVAVQMWAFKPKSAGGILERRRLYVLYSSSAVSVSVSVSVRSESLCNLSLGALVLLCWRRMRLC